MTRCWVLIYVGDLMSGCIFRGEGKIQIFTSLTIYTLLYHIFNIQALQIQYVKIVHQDFDLSIKMLYFYILCKLPIIT